MTVWLGAAALACLAVAGLVWGARRRPRRSPAPAPRQIFAAGRRALLADAAAQGLSAETVSALEEELALAVADAAPDAVPTGSEAPSPPPPLAVFGGALGVAALALALYALWGEPQAALLADSGRLLAASEPEQLTALAGALAARTRRQPKDADGWFHLGHVRLRQREFDGAARAFATLHELTGANEQVDLAWAQARYLADGGAVAPATRAIIDRVLAVRPEQPAMLELMAMNALRGGDFATASRLLARILRQPLAGGRRALLAETLDMARQRLDPTRALIEVTVEAPAEAARWLMVFARPVGGGVPLAVARQPAEPTQTIVLDDANSMTDSSQLAIAKQVEVVARISETGAADAALAEAVSEPVSPAEQPRLTLTLRPKGEPPDSG